MRSRLRTCGIRMWNPFQGSSSWASGKQLEAWRMMSGQDRAAPMGLDGACRRRPAANLAGIRTLRERRQWQRLAVHHVDRARGGLRRHRTRLDDARRDLVVEPQNLSASEWLEAFNGRFQSILDAAARRRVRAYAVKVGIGTAASRFPLLDQAIVLYACMALLRELLVLYGLRPTAVQAALLLPRSVVTTYLSGVLQDVSDEAADTVVTATDSLADDGPLQDMITEVGRGAEEAVGAGVLAPLAGRGRRRHQRRSRLAPRHPCHRADPVRLAREVSSAPRTPNGVYWSGADDQIASNHAGSRCHGGASLHSGASRDGRHHLGAPGRGS